MVKCYFCSIRTGNEKHHIIPKSQGGSNSKKNIMNLCSDCHDYFHYSRVKGLENIIINSYLHSQDVKNFERLLDFKFENGVEDKDFDKQIFAYASLITMEDDLSVLREWFLWVFFWIAFIVFILFIVLKVF